MRLLLSTIGILLLLSCSGREPRAERALTHSASPEGVRMVLRLLENSGDTKRVGILIQNPTHAPIQSIRAWVRFDPETVQVSDLTIEDGRLTLFAPNERDIDMEEGFVRIGAATREPITDSLMTLATFTMESSSTPTLTFYDWREGGDGHTAVLSLDGQSVKNLLQAPPSLEL